MVYCSWALDRTERASTPRASMERIVMNVMVIEMVEEELGKR
jgi:hypothetical protein